MMLMVTTGTAKILTIPHAACVTVGDTIIEILTTNTLVGSKTSWLNLSLYMHLKSATTTTTTIDVSAAATPTLNQTLIATADIIATW